MVTETNLPTPSFLLSSPPPYGAYMVAVLSFVYSMYYRNISTRQLTFNEYKNIPFQDPIVFRLLLRASTFFALFRDTIV
uniref:Bestrophin homolog n=1 Tax=Steinernema glaseri TaxID=37863 RepID=A0A1I7YS18_9BILA